MFSALGNGIFFLPHRKTGPKLFYLSTEARSTFLQASRSADDLEAGLAWGLEPGADVKSILEASFGKANR